MAHAPDRIIFVALRNNPVNVRGVSKFGYSDRSVLLQTFAGSTSHLHTAQTDAGTLLDGKGAALASLTDVVSNRRPDRYGICNFTDSMQLLECNWNAPFWFQQGPHEAWLRLHHVIRASFAGLKLHGYKVNGRWGPKEGVQLRSGSIFNFTDCELDTPVSVGPNEVDGHIDPNAEPVLKVTFSRCVLPELPRIVFGDKYVGRVELFNCHVAGHFVSHLLQHSGHLHAPSV